MSNFSEVIDCVVWRERVKIVELVIQFSLHHSKAEYFKLSFTFSGIGRTF